ncbi:MAG: glycoside hydrolase family 15 protein [Deltaproteobacteria bacterium]
MILTCDNSPAHHESTVGAEREQYTKLLEDYRQFSRQNQLTLNPNQPEFKAIIQGLRGLGESQFRRIRCHGNPDGSLYEQMNRRTGFTRGAPNLSWSHVSFVTTARRRNKP